MTTMKTIHNIITDPLHYDGAHGVECKEAMANMIDRVTDCKVGEDVTPTVVYWWACAFKYLWRWPFKNGIQDLRKCVECIENIERAMADEAIEDAEF